MKRPERPTTLFAALVAASALLLSGGTAHAATTANGDSLSAGGQTAEKDKADKQDAKDPDKLRQQLDELAKQHEKSQDKLDALAHKQDKLKKKVTKTRTRFSNSRDRVARTARIAYTSGHGNSPFVALTSGGEPDEVAERMTTLSLLSKRDNAAIRDANRDRKKLNSDLADLKKAKKDAAKEAKKLAGQRKKLNKALLEAARALAARKNDRASRSATMTSGGACPVGKPRQLSDSWGASRSGGRGHEGTDMLAPMGTPIFAVEDGTVSEAGTDGLGGITVILEGESGDSYYYAHNSENLVSTGEKVVAGQHIANVGMSGNAQGTVPHLHFERWPGGGNPVNPYPFVKTLCG